MTAAATMNEEEEEDSRECDNKRGYYSEDLFKWLRVQRRTVHTRLTPGSHFQQIRKTPLHRWMPSRKSTVISVSIIFSASMRLGSKSTTQSNQLVAIHSAFSEILPRHSNSSIARNRLDLHARQLGCCF